MGLPRAGQGPRDRSGEDLSIETRARAWTREGPGAIPIAPAASQPARSAALAALAGGSPFPEAPAGRCASPMILALHQRRARLNSQTREQFDRATARTSFEGELVSPDGAFRIHYTADGATPDSVDPADSNLDRVPDGVARLGETLSDLMADFVHRLDWAPAPLGTAAGQPARVRPPLIDVYLVALASPAERGATGDGYTLPVEVTRGEVTPSTEGSHAAIFLDRGVADPGGAPRESVAHQLAHVILLRESAREAPWWHESTAAWLESRIAGTATLRARWFGASAQRRASGLKTDSLGLPVESFLWPHFLTLAHGDDAIIRRLWEEMAALPGGHTLEGFDRVLRQERGSSLAEEVRIFNLWNLFAGRSDDGAHYPFGSLLATPDGDIVWERFTDAPGSDGLSLRPFDSALLRLLGDGSRGGLRITFLGDSTADWDLSLVAHGRGNPADRRLISLEIDESGEAAIALPFQQLTLTDLLIQNLATPGSPATGYSVSIEWDETIPFEVLQLSASDATRGALVEWATEREDRIAGWNVLRGPTPFGPFARINDWIVPGAGTEGPASYGWLDESARPGDKYYYVVEGVTLEGFSARSHAAGVRLPRRARTSPLPD